jgi:hypothetical protein
MKCACPLFALLFLVGGLLHAADLPDPACVHCSLDPLERLLLVPDETGNPHAEFSLTVIDMWDCTTPIGNALVEVLVAGQADGKVRLCGEAGTTGWTDANGFALLNVAGGGCYKGQDAVQIRVNGVTVRSYEAVMSPDYAGWDNAGVPDHCDLAMTPIDLASFTTAYRGGQGQASCHDYNNNGTTGPEDLSVFVSAYGGGSTFCRP